ncbi:hypothetical protein [Brachybacterium sp. UNK5269]|uniref:hypothetical protein n=1 Tax=Brachybacterium sp. UNK5269 TaxID=3408576 RepID=UPI003BB06110
MMGAAEQHPDGEAADELFAERVEVFHAEQARKAPADVETRDRRTLTRALMAVWVLALVVIVVDALVVLVSSPDVATYEAHRDLFFIIAAVGTLVYFVAAYWELRRRKSHTAQTLARREGRPAAAEAAPGS